MQLNRMLKGCISRSCKGLADVRAQIFIDIKQRQSPTRNYRTGKRICNKVIEGKSLT